MQTPDAPKKAPAKASKTASKAVKGVLNLVLEVMEDAKAEEVITIDLKGKSAMADYMVVGSGRSHRHVGAITDQILRKLKEVGAGKPKLEGQQAGDWILVDLGDIIVHIFRPEVREFYGLEKMWQVPDTQEPS